MDNEFYLRKVIETARGAREKGNPPFGALLVGPEGDILMEGENGVVTGKDCTLHAELRLVSGASGKYSREFLKECTIYASTEPCAMCAAAIFLSGIGRLVYGQSGEAVRKLRGDDPQSPALKLPCREVFARGSWQVMVEGPLMEDAVAEMQEGFW